MIIDVILGINMDTDQWIYELKKNGVDNILVIDYDNEDRTLNESVKCLSPDFAIEYLKEFDTVNFYKSLYAYPGMQGRMSSLYKKDDK